MPNGQNSENGGGPSLRRREFLLTLARGAALAALGALAFAATAGKRDGNAPCRNSGSCAQCPARRRCPLPRNNTE